MDLFFQDPSEIPLPAEEVRIRELRPEPWADGRRVRVYLEVDPFQKRPNAEISITNQNEEVVSEVSVIETMTRKMEFNMHLREAKPAGSYTIQVVLYYQQFPTVEKMSDEASAAIPDRMVVDEVQRTFELP